MTEKRRQCSVLVLTGVLLFGLAVWNVLKPADAVSASERRALAQMPKLSAEAVLNGSYMTGFESASQDQFPLCDGFRRLKAWTLRGALGQKDDHGIYLADGCAAKLDYPMNESSVEHAAERFAWIYENYLKGNAGHVYFAPIPDKNYFLAAKNGYPSMDYEAFVSAVCEKMPYADYIDLTPALTLDCYYRTDIHWRQEMLTEAAALLAENMGVTLTAQYETKTLDTPFYGVYCGQSALPLAPDTLCYLENDILRGCTVYDYETDTELPVYDLAAAEGNDAYALFLSGSKSLLTITNPHAKTGRELIVFRDSFASSLAPLLAEGYAKITLIDIRYIAPARLGKWVDFSGKDVLFLYSTPVLNSSETIK